MLTEPVIRQAAEKIAAAAHAPLKVIVFGSYARGEARNDSDLDLMIVEEEIPDLAKEYNRIRDALGPIETGVDLLIYSRSEFERRINWSSSPVFDAVRHGKVLYERST
jgi:predicted nucleotidyltransferase